jgi:hypothetical protein
MTFDLSIGFQGPRSAVRNRRNCGAEATRSHAKSQASQTSNSARIAAAMAACHEQDVPHAATSCALTTNFRKVHLPPEGSSIAIFATHGGHTAGVR